MAIVKTYVGTFDANSGNSFTGSIAIDPVASGNSLVVMFEVADTAQPVVSVGDDQSNTYDADYSHANWGWYYAGDCFWYSAGGITDAPEQVDIVLTDADSEVHYWVFEIDNLEVPHVTEEMAAGRDGGPAASQHPTITVTSPYDNEVALGFLDYAFEVDPGEYTLDAGTSLLVDSVAGTFASLYSADAGPAGSFSLGLEIVDGPWQTAGLLYKTIAGGNTYNPSIPEAISASESISAQLAAVGDVAESAGASDTLILVANYLSSYAEALDATDAISALISAAALMAEITAASVALSDALGAVGVITESLAVDDSMSAIGQFVTALTEAVIAVDSASSDGVSYSVDFAESTTLTALLEAAMSAAAQLSEQNASSEQLSAIADLNSALAEAGMAIDSLASGGSVSISIIESSAAADVVSVIDSGTLPLSTRIVSVPYRNRTIVVRFQSRTIH